MCQPADAQWKVQFGGGNGPVMSAAGLISDTYDNAIDFAKYADNLSLCSAPYFSFRAMTIFKLLGPLSSRMLAIEPSV
jgi:hypothetical protein